MELKPEYELQLLFVLALHLLYVGSSEECPRMTPKTPNIGDTLKLDCPCSETDFKLDWHYRSGVNTEERVVRQGGVNEYNFTFVVQNASFGGVYRCACAESCPVRECSECFNVSVKPTISSFTIQPPIARVGMLVTLMCNATGYPDPVLQNFQLTKGNPPVLLPPLQKTSRGITVTVNATLNHNGTFKCLVSNTVGHDVANFTATVYKPPFIVSVDNFTVNNYAMQRIAAIKCKVKNDSTAANIRWTRNGRSLEKGPNILFDSYPEALDVIQYVLTVHNLSEEYVGEYQCVAGSRFNDTDDVRSVWILEEALSVAPPIPPSTDSSNTHPAIIVAAVVIAVLVTVATVVVVIIGGSKLYRHFRERFDSNQSSSNTAGNGVSESSHYTTTSTPSIPATSEHEDTRSYTDSTVSSSSQAHEGDLISLSDQNSQHGSSCVSIPMDLNFEDGKRKGLTQEASERLRRRPLSTPDMGVLK